MTFTEQVYHVVSQIPSGKVSTYGQIAEVLGNSAYRAVGNALHNNPSPDKTPCHRVVNSQGGLAKKFAFGSSDAQRALLEQEGVKVSDNKVDLNKYLWQIDVKIFK